MLACFPWRTLAPTYFYETLIKLLVKWPISDWIFCLANLLTFVSLTRQLCFGLLLPNPNSHPHPQVTSRERNPQFCGTPPRFRDRGFYSIQPEELSCPDIADAALQGPVGLADNLKPTLPSSPDSVEYETGLGTGTVGTGTVGTGTAASAPVTSSVSSSTSTTTPTTTTTTTTPEPTTKRSTVSGQVIKPGGIVKLTIGGEIK